MGGRATQVRSQELRSGATGPGVSMCPDRHNATVCAAAYIRLTSARSFKALGTRLARRIVTAADSGERDLVRLKLIALVLLERRESELDHLHR